MANYHPPGIAGRSLSAEKLKRIVLPMEAREGPNTQDKAERFMAATGHHLEDMMATCHPPGRGGWDIIQHPVGLPTGLEEILRGLHGRNLCSVFRTVGDAETLWRP